MMEGIQDRARREDPAINQLKRRGPPPKTRFPVGHCLYLIEYSVLQTHGRQTRYKVGRTIDLNRRFGEHWHLLDGIPKVIRYWMFSDHEYLETCVKTGLKLHEVESERFIDDPNHIISVVEFCQKQHDDLCRFTKSCREQPVEF